MAQLKSQFPDTTYALNHIYRLNSDPCRGERCFGHQLIDWPLPGSDACLHSVRIGIVDTAVDRRQAGLGFLALSTKHFADSGQPSDPSHGTAVAGLLAGSPTRGYPGLLPQAKIYAADVFHTDQKGSSLTTAAFIAEGINWLMWQRVHVINISLAGPPNRLLETAVAAARRENFPLVAAAGNHGPDAAPAFPAAYDGVIAVTAVDTRLRLYARANRGDHISIAAPGVGVWTPSAEGGQYQTGTSFAAPFVSAAVAGLRAKGDMSAGAIEDHLSASAMDLGPPGKDPLYGWGLLQATSVCGQ
jgi:subtilisin family serine protease